MHKTFSLTLRFTTVASISDLGIQKETDKTRLLDDSALKHTINSDLLKWDLNTE